MNNNAVIDISALEPKWYVVFTFSGYENIVKDNILKMIEKNNLQERILDIQTPTEEVVEEKNGKRVIVERKMFPCYVLLKMRYANDLWHLIVNTRGVTSFVGPQGKPTPLDEDDIKRMRLEKVTIESDYKRGDKVQVVDGPLQGFIGDVEEVDAPNQKIRVCVSMFGRQTPVELELIQVEKL
ncbi:MAG: transcription termination/antitermination protein NusG [Clostridiales bacterium]|jgi:transcriptional antiterminator NusG|nr:transcription termination/antitermination protein NusG [Clostridiales bacterium]